MNQELQPLRELNESDTRLVYTAITPDEHKSQDTIATLWLNRTDVANAFSDVMLKQIVTLIAHVESQPHCRLLLIRGAGKHFSAGADLNWMKAAAKMTYDENITDAQLLTQMFEKIAALSIPTIAVVDGAAYGGAVGLVAACDYAVCTERAKFCLSEVRLGLLPAVIMPYLSQKMSAAGLKRLMLTGQVFGGTEACRLGLVANVVQSEEIETWLQEETQLLVDGGPSAQAAIKDLYSYLQTLHFKQNEACAAAIAKARTSSEGQQGLAAFFAKSKTPWHRNVIKK